MSPIAPDSTTGQIAGRFSHSASHLVGNDSVPDSSGTLTVAPETVTLTLTRQDVKWSEAAGYESVQILARTSSVVTLNVE